MGALSYFKIAPFIYYFNKEKSIKQISFSEINKYLQLSSEDKFRNPFICAFQRQSKTCKYIQGFNNPSCCFSLNDDFNDNSNYSLILNIRLLQHRSRNWDGFNVISFFIINKQFNLLLYGIIIYCIHYKLQINSNRTLIQIEDNQIKVYLRNQITIKSCFKIY
ncbi:unnamed protein product [Paramecium pentaurelia]|uniref:Uncharacterized protein n=1 Tax=Paramecium pentaurelia TaxID=43138 RepID=A0A8S1YID3_9CILI|nr:unnamed protein product [Paramecium pentaurelia]